MDRGEQPDRWSVQHQHPEVTGAAVSAKTHGQECALKRGIRARAQDRSSPLEDPADDGGVGRLVLDGHGCAGDGAAAQHTRAPFWAKQGG
eukprot:6962596-Prymnesium_polylepis.1